MKANQPYQVFNIRTGDYVGSRMTRKAAQRLADRLDMEYGAINYAVKIATATDQDYAELGKILARVAR